LTAASSQAQCKEIGIFLTGSLRSHRSLCQSKFRRDTNWINIFVNWINFIIFSTFNFETRLISHTFTWTWWSIFLLVSVYAWLLFSYAWSNRRFFRCKHLWHFSNFRIIIINLKFFCWWLFPLTSIKWFNSFFWTTPINRWSHRTSTFNLRLHFTLEFIFKSFLYLFCL